MKEADLYLPIKRYLEGQGYAVKAEVGDCDVVACRAGEPPIIVELKLTFSLALVMQGVARQSLFDDVYLAVPVSSARGWKLRYEDIIRLCRRLGLGLLAVEPGAKGTVKAHLDPGEFTPRKSRPRSGRLLREFERRVGDPNVGGVTGVKRVTAYRQDALRCAVFLCDAGPTRATDIGRATGVENPATLLRADHYGWFERVTRGVYQLTPQGEKALVEFAGTVAELAAT